MPLPDDIQNAPDLWLGNELYLLGYLELDASRQVLFDESPLTWFQIKDWAEGNELTADQTEALYHHAKKIDTVILPMRRKKRENKRAMKEAQERAKNKGKEQRRGKGV